MARSRRNKRNNKSKIVDYFSKFVIISIIIIIICSIILSVRYYFETVEVANQKIKLQEEIKAIYERKTPETVEEKEEKVKDTTINISIIGDILCGNGMLNDAKKEDGSYNFDSMLSEINEITKTSDIVIGTMETNFIQEHEYSGVNKYNAPIEFAQAIKNSGVDVVSIAHNHSLDYGVEGLNTSKQQLESIGIETVGTQNYVVRNIKGVKVALLAYTYGFSNESDLSTEDKQNVNIFSKEKSANDINQAKKEADYIMVIMHWGDVNSTKKNEEQEQVADYLISIGANAIVGSHPSVPQAMEMMKNAQGEDEFVSYSLGNYISSLAYENSKLQVIVNLQIRKEAKTEKIVLEKVTYTPLYVLDRGTKAENQYQVLDIKKEAKKYLDGEKNIDKKTYEKLMKSLEKIENIIRSKQ